MHTSDTGLLFTLPSTKLNSLYNTWYQGHVTTQKKMKKQLKRILLDSIRYSQVGILRHWYSISMSPTFDPVLEHTVYNGLDPVTATAMPPCCFGFSLPYCLHLSRSVVCLVSFIVSTCVLFGSVYLGFCFVSSLWLCLLPHMYTAIQCTAIQCTYICSALTFVVHAVAE